VTIGLAAQEGLYILWTWLAKQFPYHCSV